MIKKLEYVSKYVFRE